MEVGKLASKVNLSTLKVRKSTFKVAQGSKREEASRGRAEGGFSKLLRRRCYEREQGRLQGANAECLSNFES